MRIAVIAHALRTAGGLVVGQGLIASMIDSAPQHEYCFIVPEMVGYEEICSRAHGSITHSIPPMNAFQRLNFDLNRIPKLIDPFGPDVVLALDSGHALRKSPWPQAIFVHEAHLFYPKRHFGPMTFENRLRHAYLELHFKRSLSSAQVLFVQTHVVAERIRTKYFYAGEISVCGAATSTLLQTPIKSQLPMPSKFRPFASRFKLFYPTRYYPHKNLEQIVEIFRLYRHELSDVVVFLTIDVDQHPNVPSLLRRIDEWDLADQVINLGELQHEAIGVYYRHSDGLLMPTLLETFGIPYIEAMELGLPVTTSDVDFAHELCGDAAVYFDPWDTASIKEAILRLRDDEDLRTELTRAGQKRIGNARSWPDVATEVVEKLEAIAARPV